MTHSLPIVDHYHCSSTLLGKGLSSLVYKGASSLISGTDTLTGLPVVFKLMEAIKFVDPTRQALLNNEIRALSVLDHPFILSIYTIKRNKKEISIVAEYCDGGDLMQYMKKNGKFQQGQALTILTQLARALNYIHSIGILHRDLKTSNILLKSDQTIRITDFGVCEFIKERNPKHKNLNVGSPLYMSPEVFKKCQYSVKSDTWSLGVIFYEMLIGKTPFGGMDYKGMLEFVGSGDVYKSVTCSDYSRKILAGLLNPDINLRWDTVRLLTELSHFKCPTNCFNTKQSIYSKFSISPGCWF